MARFSHRVGSAPAVLAALALVGGMLAVLTTGAGATVNTCQARNLTRGTARSADLQAEIDAANPGDTIQVKRVCVGNFVIKKDLTIVGEPTRPVLKAALEGDGTGRVLFVDGAEVDVTLTNLKITGGFLVSVDGEYGGGILSTGDLTLLDTLVTGNRSGGSAAAGGIANGSEGATLILNGNSSIRGNSAEEWVGGVYNAGTLILNDDSSVKRNECVNTGGISNFGTLILNDSAAVKGNRAGVAGGIANLGDITMNGSSSVSKNTVEYGGGILNTKYGNLTMNDGATVSANVALVDGGGIQTSTLGTVTLNDHARVTQNSAGRYGGGISNATILTMTGSSSVQDNTSGDNGGGVFNDAWGTVILLDSASVTGNRADADDDAIGAGGGIFNSCYGTLTGAVNGGNVDDNYLGRAAPVENNIAEGCPRA